MKGGLPTGRLFYMKASANKKGGSRCHLLLRQEVCLSPYPRR
uniref:Uncharacterized protein n=1 Tax=uncultured alpha proteobacterium HF0010_13E22 TaxID=710801 RepID=E0XQZ3_9PROT|nr:hypothetical protein [uncultured alpha proteobacterium HF0010_13E22]